ncbi:MAG: RidA family protein [Acidobacteriota bacterium]|nr:RidA family protein [Acidobacteriota bacterium]
MDRRSIRSILAPPPPAAASPGVSAGRFVFVSAQLPIDMHGELVGATAAEQAAGALDNLAHQLRSAGLSLDDVVSLEIHLVDQADTAAVDSVLESRFTRPYPAVTLSGVPWVPGAARLQVAAVAQRY